MAPLINTNVYLFLDSRAEGRPPLLRMSTA